MSMFVVVFVVMLLVVAAMAVGVMMGRKPISGSCGGMSALGMDVACDVCKGDPEICETEQQISIKKAAAIKLANEAAAMTYELRGKQ